MADFDGVALQQPVGQASGAVLYLSEPAKDSHLVRLSGNVEVEIVAGARPIIVRGLSLGSYEGVMDAAPELCNRALDVLAISGKLRMTLSDIKTTHVAFWSDGVKSTVRLVSTSTMTMSSSAATLSVLDSSGSPTPTTPAPPSVWHESFRYFRMSQTSADLFDAFRNVYLALESILSTIEPVQIGKNGRPEGEGVWVERALAKAAGRVTLTDYLLPPLRTRWLTSKRSSTRG